MIKETPVGSLTKRDSKNVQTSYLTHIWYNFQYTSVHSESADHICSVGTFRPREMFRVAAFSDKRHQML